MQVFAFNNIICKFTITCASCGQARVHLFSRSEFEETESVSGKQSSAIICCMIYIDSYHMIAVLFGLRHVAVSVFFTVFHRFPLVFAAQRLGNSGPWFLKLRCVDPSIRPEKFVGSTIIHIFHAATPSRQLF